MVSRRQPAATPRVIALVSPITAPVSAPGLVYRRAPVEASVVAMLPGIVAEAPRELLGALSPPIVPSAGPMPAQPDMVIEEYAAALLTLLEGLDEAHQEIVEAYGDGEHREDSGQRWDQSAAVRRAQRQVRARYERRFRARERARLAEGAAAAVEQFTAASQASAVPVVGGQAGLAYEDTPEVRARAQEFAEANVQLIGNIPEKHFDRIAELVEQAYAEWWTKANLAHHLQFETGITRRRAAFIARNEIESLAGKMAQARQTAAGVSEYIWRTVGDDRVRPAHAARDGKRFAWGNPPTGGHPGEDFNCRCVAVPAPVRG